MKVNVTFEFNPLDHDTLKDLLGKKGECPLRIIGRSSKTWYITNSDRYVPE